MLSSSKENTILIQTTLWLVLQTYLYYNFPHEKQREEHVHKEPFHHSLMQHIYIDPLQHARPCTRHWGYWQGQNLCPSEANILVRRKRWQTNTQIMNKQDNFKILFWTQKWSLADWRIPSKGGTWCDWHCKYSTLASVWRMGYITMAQVVNGEQNHTTKRTWCCPSPAFRKLCPQTTPR